MDLRPRKKLYPDLNLTPLIDVVFLLLIFFMVSTTFERESQLTVELPQASSQEHPEEPPEYLDITVDREGRFYVNQQEVVNTQIATLMSAIERAAGNSRDLPLIINADAMTPHQAVITVLDAASQLGFLRITFAAREPDPAQ